MTDKQLSTPESYKRRSSLGRLSSQKVFTAFKSPCRLQQQQSSKVIEGGVTVHRDTPRPIGFPRKRKSVLATSFVSPLKCKLAKSEVTTDDIFQIEKEIEQQVILI